MIGRFLFNLHARNRHGIHSPFIYGFLDRSLYHPENREGSPNERLLRAARTHFGPDLLLWDPAEIPFGESLSGPGGPRNDTVVYAGGIRRGGNRRAWSEACAHPGVRVILETYDAGLLFFRREQAPQHFKIRI